METRFCNQYKPAREEECNLEPCPLWVYSSWSKCSVSCGEGTQSRKATCQVGTRTVDENQCYQANKDSTSKPCFSPPCVISKPMLVVDGWSECTVTCGGGQRTKQLHCELNGSKVPDWKCDSKPQITEECNSHQCPKWSVGSWSSCSKSCNGGIKTRYFCSQYFI